jgi:hypothetical protein
MPMHLTAIELTLGVAALYLLVLVLSMRKGSREVHGPWLFLLRAFFPNWKFYHAVSLSPRLYVRAQSAAGAWTTWQSVYPRATRHLGHLWHNAAVNLALTHQNLVEHLAQDVRDLPEGADARSLVTYRLVQRLACETVQKRCRDTAPMPHPHDGPGTIDACQFEVRMEMPDQSASESLLLSPVIRLWN